MEGEMENKIGQDIPPLISEITKDQPFLYHIKRMAQNEAIFIWKFINFLSLKSVPRGEWPEWISHKEMSDCIKVIACGLRILRASYGYIIQD